ncbi:MAG: glycosyl transferase, partial [Tardiphaga sp.]|nr:glycosyl transferase [Tardiphaga sp.]
RQGSRDDMAIALAERFIDVRDAMLAGRMEPEAIAGSIADFTPNTQLARVFRYHKEIQNTRAMAAAAASY